MVVVAGTQSDSIQCLNFAKKWLNQYSIQYCFTQDSIQNISRNSLKGVSIHPSSPLRHFAPKPHKAIQPIPMVFNGVY